MEVHQVLETCKRFLPLDISAAGEMTHLFWGEVRQVLLSQVVRMQEQKQLLVVGAVAKKVWDSTMVVTVVE
jgi:hypothetical protein